LAGQDYKRAENVSLGGKSPDLIGYNEREIVAFEEKKYAEELPNAIGQCLHYLNDSNKVFIILPTKEIDRIHPNTLEILRKYGKGFLENGKSTIQTVIDATYFENSIEKVLEKIHSKKQISKKKGRHSLKVSHVDKKDVINLLSEYPNGMTIQEIAKYLGASRFTVSRYVFAMQEAGYIECHEIGRAKMCFLKRGER